MSIRHMTLEKYNMTTIHMAVLCWTDNINELLTTDAHYHKVYTEVFWPVLAVCE